jgi:hypothetical protein
VHKEKKTISWVVGIQKAAGKKPAFCNATARKAKKTLCRTEKCILKINSGDFFELVPND